MRVKAEMAVQAGVQFFVSILLNCTPKVKQKTFGVQFKTGAAYFVFGLVGAESFAEDAT